MDIKKALAHDHSKKIADAITEYIGSDKSRFNQLMHVFFGDDTVLSQRASMAVGRIGPSQPQLIKPYIKKLIDHLNEPNLHDAIKRNTLRIFESIEIPSEYYSTLFDQCLKFISSEMYSVGIRAFAITTATNICKKIPELIPELKLTLTSLPEEYQKPAIKVRVRNSLKQL